MEISVLRHHRVVQVVASSMRRYLKKCNPDFPSEDPRPLPSEYYAIRVLLTIGEILTCVDQVHCSAAMLSGYRAGSAVLGMNRYDHILYAIENFYLRVTSIYDRCLIAVNLMYELGLREKACRTKAVVSNSHIQGSPVADALKELEKSTSHFRENRNIVAHQASFPCLELNQLGSVFHLFDIDESSVRYWYLYKAETDKYVSKKKAECQNSISEIERILDALFTALLPVFLERVNGKEDDEKATER